MQTKFDAMKIRGLNDALFIIMENIPINFRIPGKIFDEPQAITSFTRHVYIIERLKPKCWKKKWYFKPGDDGPKYREKHFKDGNCKNMSVKFNVNNIGPPVKRVVLYRKIIKIPTKLSRSNYVGKTVCRQIVISYFSRKKLTNWETMVMFFRIS